MINESTGRRSAIVAEYRFGDLESFQDSFHGLELDLRQLDCGSFRGDMRVVSTPSVVMTECNLNRQIEQCGSPRAGYWTFGIPAGDRFHMRWRGRDVGSENVMIFRPDEEIDCKSNAEFHVFSVMVPERQLVSAAERLGVSSIEEVVGSDSVLRLAKSSQAKLRQKLSEVIGAAVGDPTLAASPPFLTEIEGELVTGLCEEISRAQHCDSRSMTQRRGDALRKALALIDERTDEPIQVAELERQSGVSSRTLRYAFLEEFGVSPKQYLLALRLNRVRRQLLSERPRRGLVSDVANDWGFWHMGEFAAFYRRMFAELPSQTIGREPVSRPHSGIHSAGQSGAGSGAPPRG